MCFDTSVTMSKGTSLCPTHTNHYIIVPPSSITHFQIFQTGISSPWVFLLFIVMMNAIIEKVPAKHIQTETHIHHFFEKCTSYHIHYHIFSLSICHFSHLGQATVQVLLCVSDLHKKCRSSLG